VELVIFGDFNCPFSAVASARAARLEAGGAITVDWRAVEHDPSIPASGRPVAGRLADELAAELASIRDRLAPGERVRLLEPAVMVNTAGVVAAFAGVAPDVRGLARWEVFRSSWEDGVDIAAPGAVPALPAPDSGVATAARWRAEWASVAEGVVPVMVMPDGTAVRGVAVLDRLRTALARTAPAVGADEGGEAPCFAPLLDAELGLF
jgi:hypothetical protein